MEIENGYQWLELPWKSQVLLIANMMVVIKLKAPTEAMYSLKLTQKSVHEMDSAEKSIASEELIDLASQVATCMTLTLEAGEGSLHSISLARLAQSTMVELGFLKSIQKYYYSNN